MHNRPVPHNPKFCLVSRRLGDLSLDSNRHHLHHLHCQCHLHPSLTCAVRKFSSNNKNAFRFQTTRLSGKSIPVMLRDHLRGHCPKRISRPGQQTFPKESERRVDSKNLIFKSRKLFPLVLYCLLCYTIH